MVAARRALRIEGDVATLIDPVLVEIVPPSNIAVGTVPWGLSRWVRPDSVYRISTRQNDAGAGGEPTASVINTALAATASGRPLLVVVRDAHRYPVAQSLVRDLLAARPAAVVVEMGLPVWHPPAEVISGYIWCNTCKQPSRGGTARAGSGLTREVSAHGPDRP